MLKVNKHKIKSNKIKKKQKILLIADVHLWYDYNQKIIDNIIINTKKLSPTFICVCGDIIVTIQTNAL